MTITLLVILSIIYLIIDSYLRRRLKTKSRSFLENIYKGRKILFIAAEIVLLISFLILIYSSIPISSANFVFIYPFILYLIRSVEEWMYKRKDKEFYHSLLAASFYLIAFLIIYMIGF